MYQHLKSILIDDDGLHPVVMLLYVQALCLHFLLKENNGGCLGHMGSFKGIL